MVSTSQKGLNLNLKMVFKTFALHIQLCARHYAKARAEVRREERVAAAAEAERAAAEAEAAGAWMREAQAEANRLRVDFRREEEARRAEERERKDAAAAEEDEEKERRLRRLRETVAPVVARDAKRAVGGDVTLPIHTTTTTFT